jgi:hypothetical protein
MMMKNGEMMGMDGKMGKMGKMKEKGSMMMDSTKAK